MGKKISIIVPVYNTVNELYKCLKSIQNQTYTNLEIICIDDGSTDGSEKIVEEFASKDARFVVIHQENAGESNARNVGLKRATGEYIAFCDCDDWLENQMYEVLLSEMENEQLDIVASSWMKELYDKTEIIKNRLPVTTKVFGRDELLRYLYMRDSYRGFAYMWNKLYRREVLEDKYGELILFDEDLKLGGDVLFLARVALNVKRAKYVDQAFYHYLQRDSSGCHTKDVNKLKDWVKAYEYIINIFETKDIDKNIIDYVKRFMAYHSSNATEIAISEGNIEAKQYFQKIMRLYYEEYINLNNEYPKRIQRYNNLLMK